jgi:Rrf2 family protein
MRHSPLLHVTLELEHAVRTLLVMRDGLPRTCSGIAAATALSPQTSSKVLQKLKRAGLVRCRGGSSGGYRLAQPATSIAVADVVVAVQGQWDGGVADRAAADSLDHLWQAIDDDLRRKLGALTLLDLMSPASTEVRPSGR